ncbi:hypothetical protein DS745_23415 [Anaerobacillus alkaliphilus]|uniref:Uncharacterized protein n=1 Tax=Anaerobacillus alkaliphilus TaxID=1548597 RepID=A0A4Q0VMT1_9BACI|nr:hypothetical protein DS745_23415 [Anaerobacillus alkaliphilus]
MSCLNIRGFENEKVNVAKEYEALKKCHKIIAVIFLIVNYCLIWVAIFISEIVVSLGRLSELNGYMLTEKEEVMFFGAISISMFLIQVVYLLFVFNYLKKRQFKTFAVILNLIAHFLLFIWFVFSVYQFTINGY